MRSQSLLSGLWSGILLASSARAAPVAEPGLVVSGQDGTTNPQSFNSPGAHPSVTYDTPYTPSPKPSASAAPSPSKNGISYDSPYKPTGSWGSSPSGKPTVTYDSPYTPTHKPSSVTYDSPYTPSSVSHSSVPPSQHSSAPPPGQTGFPSGHCGQNGPTNRACWMDTYSVYTDYEEGDAPKGITRTIDLTVTNVTNFQGPDGVTKQAMLINGVFPGPPIIADWGDILVINVHNQLQDNGTGFHWHGIRQLGSNDQDGANGLTECPIPPGHTRTYQFHLTQYGTTWYHSHFTSQYGNGLFGTIQINGPASADYDIDLGPYPITDYYHTTADRNQIIAQSPTGPPPASDNVMFNGSNINPLTGGGKYNRVTLTPGKKHLLRLVNPSVEHGITVSLSGHKFTVVETDFVPVVPVEKDSLFLSVGQRYNVIIEADQKVDNYWFNVTLAQSRLCGTSNNTSPAAIFSYAGAPAGNPTAPGAAVAADCLDTLGWTPIVHREVPQDKFRPDLQILDVTLVTPTINGQTVFRWEVNGSSIDVSWENPTLEYVSSNNGTFPTDFNVLTLPDANVWTFWVIENSGPVPHPIHLHGHDVLFLGSAASSTFDPVASAANMTFSNPIRRDVVMLPSSGWLAVAFQTNNPGAWLMHCHIAWHVSEGLSVQFLERAGDIGKTMDLKSIEPNCEAWRKYVPTAVYQKDDSGL